MPADPAMLRDNCYEAYNIQVQGLAQRLKATGLKQLVIGVSGGLDSTQALIVSARVMDRLGLPRANVLAYTLPGFATSSGTKSNAWRLMRALGVTGAEIDIRPAANQMLADIGHASASGEAVYDVTFENVQAGLRTDYLFRLANHNGGLVVGTGDLSELALGWCTYGVGDQMSHYNPNASVSKTLIQHLIRFVASSGDVSAETAAVLLDILGDRDFAGAGAGRRRRRDPVDREHRRSLRAAGFQPVLYDPLRLCAVEDRLSCRGTPGTMPSRARGRPTRRTSARRAYRSARDQALAARVSAPLLRAEPVQALGPAERAEDLVGRLAVAARRLARAVRFARRGLARRTGAQRPGHGVAVACRGMIEDRGAVVDAGRRGCGDDRAGAARGNGAGAGTGTPGWVLVMLIAGIAAIAANRLAGSGEPCRARPRNRAARGIGARLDQLGKLLPQTPGAYGRRTRPRIRHGVGRDPLAERPHRGAAGADPRG